MPQWLICNKLVQHPCWAKWPQCLVQPLSSSYASFICLHRMQFLPFAALQHFRFRRLRWQFLCCQGDHLTRAPSIVKRLLTIPSPEMAYVDGWSASWGSVQFGSLSSAALVVFARLLINPIISCKAMLLVTFCPIAMKYVYVKWQFDYGHG